MTPSDDRSSNVEFEDCPECAHELGSGVCSNCVGDGSYCPECRGTGRCQECEGTGRRPVPVDPDLAAEVEAAGPLKEPDEDALLLLRLADEGEGRCDPERIARRRPDSTSRQAFAHAQERGWLDNDGWLTPAGYEALSEWDT